MTGDFPNAPIVDVAPLFAGEGPARAAAVRTIGEAVATSGVFVARGGPEAELTDRRGLAMLRFFALGEAEKAAVATRRNRPEARNSYRGYVSTFEENRWAYNEMYDIGPERPVTAPPDILALRGAEIFTEPNAWPAREPAPGWRAAMLAYFARMEALSMALLHALADHLGLPRDEIAARFDRGNSTLRLLNYPTRPDSLTVGEPLPDDLRADSERPQLVTGRHTDACALSLLWQREPGLQGQAPDGTWYAVPPEPNGVSVHLGDVVEQITGGRLPATPHRVTDNGAPRGSIGFFLEPKLEASCAPVFGESEAPPGGDSYAAHLLRRFSGYDDYENLVESPD